MSKSTKIIMFAAMIASILALIVNLICFLQFNNKLGFLAAEFSYFSFAVCTAIAVGISFAYAVTNTLHKNTLLILFDSDVIQIVILMFLNNSVELMLYAQTLSLCLIAFLITLLALIFENVGKYAASGSSVQGKVLLALTAGTMAIVSIVFAVISENGIKSLVLGFISALKWIYSAAIIPVLHAVNAALVWFAGLFDIKVKADLYAEPLHIETPKVWNEVLYVIPTWIYILLGVLVTAVLIKAIIVLSQMKREAKPKHIREVKNAVRVNSARAHFKSWVNMLALKIKYCYNKFRYRKTAAALLAFCERKAAKDEKRRRGESGEAFLIRLSKKEGREVLVELAAAVEKQFYSKEKVAVSGELYRNVRRMKV